MRKSCSWVPCSGLFLLLLLLPPLTLLSRGSLLYTGPDWGYSQDFGLGSRSFLQVERQGSRHNWHQRAAEQEQCQVTPDLYFVLDKRTAWSRAITPDQNRQHAESKSGEEGPDLRVSFITYSCKGNIILPLTSDREEINKGLERLKYSIPAGYTLLYRGLYKANKQIEKVNSGGVKGSSVIISLLDSSLEKSVYENSKNEADRARKNGANIFCVSTGNADRTQIVGIAERKENTVWGKETLEHLQNIVKPLISMACPSIKFVENSTVCLRGTSPVVIHGYGFNFVKGLDRVICRYIFSDMSISDKKAISMTESTLTCPGPNIENPGAVINVEISLNKGRNFLNNNIFVTSSRCGTTNPPPTTTTTTTTTKPPITTTPTTTSTPTVTEEVEIISEFALAPIGLSLLLTLLLLGCFWQLCRVPPVKEPPPPPPPPEKSQKKKLPPPVPPPMPAPTVNVCPTVIICCCLYCGVCVNRGLEGRCSNFALMKALSEQDPCSPPISFPPSQECLPVVYCSQCHQLPDQCSRTPSKMLVPFPPPACIAHRAPLSLPPM